MWPELSVRYKARRLEPNKQKISASYHMAGAPRPRADAVSDDVVATGRRCVGRPPAPLTANAQAGATAMSQYWKHGFYRLSSQD